MSSAQRLQLTGWSLGAVTVGLAVAVWGQQRWGHTMTIYDIFPVLGLSAFSLMWTHYTVGALRRYWGLSSNALRVYLDATGAVVLGLILLHPGLLWFGLWHDGFGLPPQSYWRVYTGFTFHVATVLGSVSLVVFLLFEFRRRFARKRWWSAVEYTQIAAMVAIFYHGLTLGGELAQPWYRAIWYLYGITFVGAVSYTYRYDNRHTKRVGKEK